jgi:flagellar protein FliO/FliZ
MWTQYILVMLVLVGVLGAIGLLAHAIQRGWILQNLTGLKHLTASQRRLSISETMVIDPRRRVVVVKCDDTEHILLLGTEREMLLSSQPARPAPLQAPRESMS